LVNFQAHTANNYNILLIYLTNEKMHLIIHKAYKQAIAFAQILEFIQYKDFFYNKIFNKYILIYKNNVLEENLN